MIYADSSFLVSLYLNDANAAAARREIQISKERIGLSRIAELEVRNAFRLAVFRGWIDATQEAKIQTHFEDDKMSGFLCPLHLSADELMLKSEALSQRYTAITGNRTLDLLHLSAAQLADLKVFASFDVRQSSLAETLGFHVIPRFNTAS